MDDFNSKVGKESWAETVVEAQSSHDESKGNEQRLINVAVQQRMMIGGPLFPHKSTHKKHGDKTADELTRSCIN
jgi:hypothetical protein